MIFISIIGLIIPIILFIFLIIFFMKVEVSKLYSFYVWIVSFVSIIAIWITLWVVLTSIWKFYIISDEEYLQSNQSYRLNECKNPTFNTIDAKTWITTSGTKTPSEEEIQKCEAKVREEVKFSRAYDLKDTFIASRAWFLVFLMLFLFHYPKFLKTKND